MKVKEIATMYGIDPADFVAFLKRNNHRYTEGFGGITVDDADVAGYVTYYQNAKFAVRASAEAAAQRAAQEAAWKQRAMSEMLITSGFNFDGYTITKYSGYISGDDCVSMPRDNFWGTNKVSDNLCAALVKIRRQAIMELKEAAYNLGCNAVIGVDFDYMTMDPQHASAFNAQITVYEPYVICVTANGNAVIIEKNTL